MEPTTSTSDNNDNKNCDCIIEKLLKQSFSNLQFKEKETIIANGRPKPKLELDKKN